MTTYARRLGAYSAAMAVVGGIIGSGIFVGPAVVAQRVGTAGLTITVWVLGGAIALAGALCFAELGARRPAAGGSYVYLREAFGPLPAFLYGWMLLFAISTGAAAAVAVTFARYFLPLVGLPAGAEVPVAVTAIVLLTVVNYRGVRPASITVNVFTTLKLIALGVVILVGLIAVTAAPVLGATPPDVPRSGLIMAVGAALVPVLFAYGGWQQTNFIAEEIIEPQRNLPRALLVGTAVVVLVYVLANLSYLRALGVGGLALSRAPAADLMFAALEKPGLTFVSAGIAVSTFGFLNLVIMVTPRVYQAMAADGLFFERLARLHPKYRTPTGAIVLQGVWAVGLTFTGSYGDLLDYVVFADWIFFGLTAATLFVFRRGAHPLSPSETGKPERRATFRTPGYPWVPAFFVLAAVYVVISSIGSNIRNAALGSALLILGVPVFWIWSRRHGSTGRVVPLALGSLIVAAQPALAQVRPLTAPAAFAIDQWTTRDGLPQNSVTALAQTPDGYLWVGTFGGLARFDGTTFTLIERHDRSGRHIDRIVALAVGRDSALWIGTETGLFRYHRGAYDTLAPPGVPQGGVATLFVDRSGTVWVATPHHGVVRYADGRFHNVTAVNGAPLNGVTAFDEDVAGTISINLGDRVYKLESGGFASARTPDPRAIHVLLRDRAGSDWFATSSGILRWTNGAAQAFGRDAGVRRPASMAEDPQGGYWLATTNDGLFFLDTAPGAGPARHYVLPDGRARYRVRATLVGAEGNVWFGTDADGLLRARRNLFTTYTSAHGLSHDVMTAVFGDAAGVMWVGTNCFGLNAIDLARRTVRVFKPRRTGDPTGDPCVFSLTEAPAGTIWSGTWGGGLTRLTGGREAWLRRPAGLRDSVVLALYTDRDGVIWIGTQSGGLAALHGDRVGRTYTTADGLAHNNVRTIEQTRDGVLWIGTLGGLSRLADGRITTYGAEHGLTALHVRAIHEDTNGDLWIGTYGGGIHRFREGRFYAITQRDGLADDVVSTITEDDRGQFWMSGNRGIYRVSRSDLVAFTQGRRRRVHSVLYRESDGLQNAETNGGFQPAAWKDAAGRLWFPTVRGVAVVDPARVTVVTKAPPVMIEELVVNGVAQPPTADLLVGRGRSNLEFRYAGLSLSAPQHVTYRYRLLGFDDDWVEAGARRVAYYPRLSPGHYRFEVTAANRDGVRSESAATLAVRVVGPFWGTSWFRVLTAAALTAVLAMLMRRRTREEARRRAAHEEFARRLIESQEHERKRVAGELHDGLGQELLVIKNRAALALRADGLAAPVRQQLEHIGDVVTQSLNNVRGLAHNLTPYQLDHLGLSAALRAMIAEAAETVDIAFQTTVDEVDGLLPVASQINLYRIVQEALSNVVRHSGASEAGVQVRRTDKAIIATISDNGKGFAVVRDAAGRLAGGFGLSGIAERARILDGWLDVWSVAGQGSRIELRIDLAPTPAPRRA